TKTRSPQTNGICERFHRTVLDEFYRVTLRKRVYRSISELQIDLWADTSYRSAKNEALLAKRRLISRILRKKPRGRLMAACTRRANARKSAVRAAVEHVFAHQKGPMALVIRT